jgi:hypothetical protein
MLSQVALGLAVGMRMMMGMPGCVLSAPRSSCWVGSCCHVELVGAVVGEVLLQRDCKLERYFNFNDFKFNFKDFNLAGSSLHGFVAELANAQLLL